MEGFVRMDDSLAIQNKKSGALTFPFPESKLLLMETQRWLIVSTYVCHTN
jgi:hypothetical protein